MPSEAHQKVANLLRGSFGPRDAGEGEIDVESLREELEAITASTELPDTTRCEPVGAFIKRSLS
jgi:hypothetical protein